MPDLPSLVRSDPALRLGDSVPITTDRVTPQGDLVMNMHGSMYETSRCGSLFYVAQQAAVAYSVDLTTTYTGLAIANPVDNEKQFVIRAVKLTVSLAQAALSYVGIMGGAIGATYAHTTPMVWGTNFGCLNLGSATAATALCDSAATITTPMYLMGLGATALANGAGQETQSLCDMKGSIILQPGYWAAIWTLTELTGWGTIWWEELPLD